MPSTLFLIFFFIFFPDPSNTSIPAKSSFPAQKIDLATDALLGKVEGEHRDRRDKSLFCHLERSAAKSKDLAGD